MVVMAITAATVTTTGVTTAVAVTAMVTSVTRGVTMGGQRVATVVIGLGAMMAGAMTGRYTYVHPPSPSPFPA